MASRQSTVDYLMDQLSDCNGVHAKKMFGDYGVFLSDRMIGLICDNQLYFKPTEKGRALFETVTEGIPYPGAKPCLQVPEDMWDDREWLSELARITARELPPPKPKKKRPRGE